jgi:hypothetical protein
MPHVFAQVPYPQASLAVLEVFTTLAGIDLDLTELGDQARAAADQLGQLLARVERAYGPQGEGEEEEFPAAEPAPEPERLSPAAERRLEALFTQAAQDRAKAFELKQELDRLGVFKDYEDRFLDLFRKAK